VSEDQPVGLPQGAHPQARMDAAAALRRLGHAFVGHDLDLDLLRQIERMATDLAAAAAAAPSRSRRTELMRHERFSDAIEAGGLRVTLANGSPLELFADSVVSGAANPMGIAIRARRDGNEAVAEVSLGPAFEGAPDRAHGGVVAAILDETMGFLLPILGVVAFTGSLTIDYLAPTPLATPLEFRAWLRVRAGRRLYIDASGVADGTTFVRASATFIEIDLGAFAAGSVSEAPPSPEAT
jgi:acyl-coenzyme A thioesterase PaaI-like protein